MPEAEGGAYSCPLACGGRAILWGRAHNGARRVKCRACDATGVLDRHGARRLPLHKESALAEALDQGLSIRKAARLADVARNTAHQRKRGRLLAAVTPLSEMKLRLSARRDVLRRELAEILSMLETLERAEAILRKDQVSTGPESPRSTT